MKTMPVFGLLILMLAMPQFIISMGRSDAENKEAERNNLIHVVSNCVEIKGAESVDDRRPLNKIKLADLIKKLELVDDNTLVSIGDHLCNRARAQGRDEDQEKAFIDQVFLDVAKQKRLRAELKKL